ncbi:MAG: DUF1638 domain-containing protein [Gammaproteobacteria bacterium]|nr:DUF1638 domain-containing protein [Gammaproteobacteria bacterium]
MPKCSAVLIIACGALAREIVALVRANRWQHMTVQCLPAEWHNTPDKIPDGVRDKIRAARGRFARIFVAYADCGTGGQLDQVLKEEGVERIPGAHCYEFFAGAKTFAELSDAEPGTFYLTDFLAQHFDRLIYRGLGLDRHPQLMPEYFGNYRKLVYLAQIEEPRLVAKAREAAKYLGLEFEYRFSGYGDLTRALAGLNAKTATWPS